MRPKLKIIKKVNYFRVWFGLTVDIIDYNRIEFDKIDFIGIKFSRIEFDKSE